MQLSHRRYLPKEPRRNTAVKEELKICNFLGQAEIRPMQEAINLEKRSSSEIVSGYRRCLIVCQFGHTLRETVSVCIVFVDYLSRKVLAGNHEEPYGTVKRLDATNIWDLCFCMPCPVFAIRPSKVRATSRVSQTAVIGLRHQRRMP